MAVSYVSSSENVFILGDTFLRNFVTTFNYEDGTIELVKNVDAPGNETEMTGLGTWAIIGISVGALVFLIAACWLFICCWSRKKQGEGKDELSYNQIGSDTNSKNLSNQLTVDDEIRAELDAAEKL